MGGLGFVYIIFLLPLKVQLFSFIILLFLYYLNTTCYSEPVQNCNNNLFHIRVPAVCSAATLNSLNQHLGYLTYLIGLDITKSRLHIYLYIDFLNSCTLYYSPMIFQCKLTVLSH